MENETFKKLGTLIEALTHSGSNVLDEDVFKQVKKICKSSQNYIPKAYDLLLKQLKKNNSQIRFVAFQMCVELFNRSGLFREHLLKDLQLILELTTEIKSSKRLPLPRASAESLKTLAISTLKKWVEEFGETYKKLKITYNYLKKCHKVDFESLEVRNSAEQVLENEQQRLQRSINSERMEKLTQDMNNNECEIETTITSLSNCLNLLIPPVEDFFVPENNLESTATEVTANNSDDEEDEASENDLTGNGLRQHGITSNYSLSLQLNPNDKIKIVKTEENSSVIENAKDCVKLISNRFLPMIKRWSQICCKYSERDSNTIKKILDLKEKLENVLKKYNRLSIEGECNVDDKDSSSEDEFEEVKKEGYEDTVNFSEDEDLVKLHSCKGNEKKTESPMTNTPDVTSIPSSSKEVPCSTPQDRKSKLMAIAPKLPFDIDLYHWEDKNLTTPTLISTKIDVDKFWGSSSSDDIHEIPNPEGLAALRTRVIEFTGKFEPVKWSCRAPLPNGKLCPRKDRYKCPFHGKIVARDATGKCQNEADNVVAGQSTGTYSAADWQDPELLQDIKVATGIDLKVPEKKGKRKKSEKKNLTHKKMKTSAGALRIIEAKKLPGLVDVVRKQDNSKTRLRKKIFNRSSLRRVSSVLNKLDRNKFQDKFGDQFNYI